MTSQEGFNLINSLFRKKLEQPPEKKPKPPFAVLCKFGLHQRETVYDRPSHSLLKCKRCGAEWVDDMFGFVERQK